MKEKSWGTNSVDVGIKNVSIQTRRRSSRGVTVTKKRGSSEKKRGDKLEREKGCSFTLARDSGRHFNRGFWRKRTNRHHTEGID